MAMVIVGYTCMQDFFTIHPTIILQVNEKILQIKWPHIGMV